MRVVIGAFGAVARLGIRDLLDKEGFDVVAEQAPGASIVDRLTDARPDVVFLDLDSADSLSTADWITSSFPAVKVIACSADELAMRVWPPFHRGESYLSSLDRDLLVKAIRG